MMMNKECIIKYQIPRNWSTTSYYAIFKEGDEYYHLVWRSDHDGFTDPSYGGIFKYIWMTDKYFSKLHCHYDDPEEAMNLYYDMQAFYTHVGNAEPNIEELIQYYNRDKNLEIIINTKTDE